MKKYDTILWDVDGTLLNFLKSEEFALKKAFQDWGISITQEIVSLYSGINDSYWKRLEKGQITKEEVLFGRFETLFETLGENWQKEDGNLGENIRKIPVSEFQKHYQTALGSVYYYQDDSYQLCQRLKKDFKQYIVTNGVEWTQRNKLKLAGFTELMEDIFISEVIGTPKPDVRFFEECFRRIPDFRRETTIIIGDSLSSDMLGGNRANIATCWYNKEALEKNMDVTIDYEIRNLWEVEKILWQNPQTKN